MVLDREQQKREVREAIEAGNITLGCLQQALDELNSAASFGLADLFGFDLIGGIGKHVKIDNAKKKMQQAQIQAEKFRSELADLKGMLSQSVNIDGMWTFMDFFLDGFIMDFLVQDKIEKAKRQVEDCIQQVNHVLDELYRMERQL